MLHRTGSAWLRVAGGTSQHLLGVWGSSPSDVWAVGGWGAIERFNGSGWTATRVPLGAVYPSGQAAQLNGVTEAASGDGWAVGTVSDPSSFASKTLAYHWDGSAWALVTTPNVGSSHNFLNAIDAISSNDVWAVGQYWGSDSMNRPLTEHWDGNQWTVVPSPDVAGARLEGVTALSSSDVWAVGDATGESFAIHWDGSSWTQVPIPSEGAETYLWDVDGASSNDVWAVGYGTRDNQDWESVILHWDGTNWSYFPHPHPTHLLEDQYFYGVASVPGGEAWAVGTFGSGITITYTQRFSAC